MIADDLFPAHARPWWLDRSRELSRALAPLPGLGLAWWLAGQMLSTAIWMGLIGYCLAHLVVTNVFVAGRVRRRRAALAQGELLPEDYEDELVYKDEA